MLWLSLFGTSQPVWSPVWARGRCRISPPRFLAKCCKRQLNEVSLVLLYFRLSAFSDLYWVCLSVFSCTVLFVSISQVIGCEDRLWNDLYCVGWGVKLYSNQTKPSQYEVTPARKKIKQKKPVKHYISVDCYLCLHCRYSGTARAISSRSFVLWSTTTHLQSSVYVSVLVCISMVLTNEFVAC